MLIDTDDLVDSHDIAEMLGLTSHRAVSVYRQRYTDFPEPVLSKCQGRCTLYRRSDIAQWASTRPTTSPDARTNNLTSLSNADHVE